MTKEEQMTWRILNVIPPDSIEMNTFFSLFRLRLTTSVPTACVTCAAEPELLINPDFVDKHCKTDEHLFMLVMHELYHVILGHTHLFPHPTLILNIIFDAIINAILCNQFKDTKFTSFFTELYHSDKMPEALLRPQGDNTPIEAEEALKLLYTDNKSVTYFDVYKALVSMHVCQCGEVVLLGSHDMNGKNDSDNPLLDAVIREITKNWTNPNRPLEGQDAGTNLHNAQVSKVPRNKKLENAILKVMKRAHYHPSIGSRKRCINHAELPISTFIVNAKDRLSVCRRELYTDVLMYQGLLNQRTISYDVPFNTFVYLDVSGSMKDILPTIFSSLYPFCIKHECLVYAFSTKVQLLTQTQIKAFEVPTTNGTNIDCVMNHLMSLSYSERPRSVLLITDGDTGAPTAEQIEFIHSHHISIYCVLTTSRSNATNFNGDLSPIVKQFISIQI